MSPIAPEAVAAAGAAAGNWIQHQRGCTLGDRIKLANDLGYFPALVTTTTRCGR